MTPLGVTARFAAYSWFLEQPENKDKSPKDARQYADRHYAFYLDAASAYGGWGRLLLTLMDGREHDDRPRRFSEPNPQRSQRTQRKRKSNAVLFSLCPL